MAMKYKGFLLATAGGLAMAPGAQAADMQLKAPVMVPPPVSWAGFYIGAHAGAVWQHGQASGSTESYDIATMTSTSATSFIGGAQVGYNFQHGNLVYGGEADFSWLSSGASQQYGTTNLFLKQNTDWLSTARLRMGLAVGDTMAYVTGGIAFGHVNNSLQYTTCTTDCKSESKTRVGWAVGGGVEHMWDRHWTVALEGLFVDLGNSTVTSPNGSKSTHFANQLMIGRFKLNYKF